MGQDRTNSLEVTLGLLAFKTVSLVFPGASGKLQTGLLEVSLCQC